MVWFHALVGGLQSVAVPRSPLLVLLLLLLLLQGPRCCQPVRWAAGGDAAQVGGEGWLRVLCALAQCG
jgi:hypothetical protein